MKEVSKEDKVVIVGETTLHGSFKSADESVPTGVYAFETIQGESVTCNLSADIAIEAGVQIALTGVAEYDIRTFESYPSAPPLPRVSSQGWLKRLPISRSDTVTTSML